jgi:Fe2+ transport system protein FeoA
MTLLEAQGKKPVRILHIPDDRARAQCIRFGIGEGTVVDSAERLPLGPVLIRHHNQEICLGRNLARRILIEDPGHVAHGRTFGASETVQSPRRWRRFGRR